jgi:hypothetical protein
MLGRALSLVEGSKKGETSDPETGDETTDEL